MNAQDRIALHLGRAIVRAEQLADALEQARSELTRVSAQADTTERAPGPGATEEGSAMATEQQLAAALTKHGFLYATQILVARTTAKLGLPVALGMLTMETGNAKMIYGHDMYPGGIKAPGYGWGEVTKENYAAFKHLRQTTGRSNGVGSCQLTSPSLQDEADAAGGCWVPQHNLAVGFHYLHDLIKKHGLENGCAAYNGGEGGIHEPGPAAYGAQVVALANHYKAIGLGTVVGVLD